MADFWIYRRKPGIADILCPKRVGVKGYRFEAATEAGGSYTALFTADVGCGFLDPAVNRAVLTTLNNRDHVRVVFNPQTYNVAAGISDTVPFWLRLVPVDFLGADGADGDPVLIQVPN